LKIIIAQLTLLCSQKIQVTQLPQVPQKKKPAKVNENDGNIKPKR
jgi:hypothetical protein